MQDTMHPFGSASLESHSCTFLGFGKLEILSELEMAHMRDTFRKRPNDVYGYCIRDAINTLLVYEQMQFRDRGIYQSFGFDDGEIPNMRGTLGSRVADLIERWTRKWIGGTSAELTTASAQRQLMQRGGEKLFQHGHLTSKFGEQTCKIHGGLSYSRSTTKFFQAAKGMLRDVDMSGCYNAALAPLHVYWGRPIVFEPGSKRLSLRAAVQYVNNHADDDAWFIRVTGEILSTPNVLIPSTEGAITSENYQSRKRQRMQAAALKRSDIDPAKGARLYSKEIEAGIVTRDTWLVIQALPEELRAEYENLNADSIIFYPHLLAANNGAEHDELVARYKSDQLPWKETLNMHDLLMIKEIRLDAEYVSLKVPIGEKIAKHIGRAREHARRETGKGSGEDVAWKLHANTTYGVLSSPHFSTNNFVAANLITAKARAEACRLTFVFVGWDEKKGLYAYGSPSVLLVNSLVDDVLKYCSSSQFNGLLVADGIENLPLCTVRMQLTESSVEQIVDGLLERDLSFIFGWELPSSRRVRLDRSLGPAPEQVEHYLRWFIRERLGISTLANDVNQNSAIPSVEINAS